MPSSSPRLQTLGGILCPDLPPVVVKIDTNKTHQCNKLNNWTMTRNETWSRAEGRKWYFESVRPSLGLAGSRHPPPSLPPRSSEHRGRGQYYLRPQWQGQQFLPALDGEKPLQQPRVQITEIPKAKKTLCLLFPKGHYMFNSHTTHKKVFDWQNHVPCKHIIL